jgi:proteic killer suppression protein
LKGARADQHSIRLNDQWRLILHFRTGDDGKSVVVIEIVDYH